MSNKDALHLFLKHKWFDLINSGEKKTEYRSFNSYWNTRFINNEWATNLSPDKDYTWKCHKMRKVVFHKGYSNTTVAFWIKNISCKVNIENDLNESPVWVIKLGDRIEVQK